MERGERATFEDKGSCPDLATAELTGNGRVEAEARLQDEVKLSSNALEAFEALSSRVAGLLQTGLRHRQSPEKCVRFGSET
ncbi:hypothetical protein B5P45_14095 [Phyllobacterium zundukense]|uniref:Uncharacterized protein n=1 Tax=Phyllobacterium zundukense TaxID=1867719 RepID=A0A2N9VY15_9HYPH|nr:hypothetical protein B5P45_14095 [Phyllobacterium zundukense]